MVQSHNKAGQTIDIEKQRTIYLELISKYYNDIRQTIISLVGNHHDADDVIQDTCLAIWRHFDQYDESRSFRNWACMIAANHSRNFLRRGSRRTGLSLPEAALNNLLKVQVSAGELFEMRSEKLAECIGQLKVDDQELIRQCYGSDVKAVQWAKQHNLPTSTVYNRLSRIRTRLYDCVNRKLGLKNA